MTFVAMTCHLELSPVPTDHPVNHQVPQNILWGLLTTLTKEKKKDRENTFESFQKLFIAK